jgi:predicted Zn-dependent peptidase
MRTLLFVSAMLLLSSCSVRDNALHPSAVELPPVQFVIPRPVEWRLSNGMTVLFLENRELPLMEAELFLPIGSLHIEQPGLLEALISQMRNGGVQGLSPQQLDRQLDSLAGTIEGSVSAEFSSFSLASHSEDFPEILGLLRRILTEPAFDESRLTLWKAQSLDSIKRRREDPQTMAYLTFAKAFYAGPAPFYESLKSSDLKRITKRSLAEARTRLITPHGTILCITGSIAEEELRKLLEEKLGPWAETPGQIAPVATPRFRDKPGIYLVRARFDQASVVMGVPGPGRDYPAYHALSVFNRYFSSGGLSSVLFNEIRTRRGLAYSVGGGFSPGKGAGIFQLGVGTRVAQVGSALLEIVRLVGLTRYETAQGERLREVKESIERGFVFNFAFQAAILEREATRRLLGLPENFDSSYLEKVRGVTENDLLDVAKSFIQPEKLVIAVVGDVDPAELSRVFPELPIYTVQFDEEPVIFSSPLKVR